LNKRQKKQRIESRSCLLPDLSVSFSLAQCGILALNFFGFSHPTDDLMVLFMEMEAIVFSVLT